MLMQNVCADMTVTRDLPETATLGSEITVNLKLDIVGGETPGIIITEKVPEGWSVSSVSNEGSFDREKKEIRWLLYGENVESQTLSYVCAAPSKADNYTFSGTYTTLEEGVGGITGDEKISINVEETAGTGEDVKGYDMRLILGIIAAIVVIVIIFILIKRKKR